MSSLFNILAGAALLVFSALAGYWLCWWKERNLKRAKSLEAEALLRRAQTDTEMLVRDARLAANEEALKLREQIEQSFAARRAERSELERRLTEREALINSQLQSMVE